MKLLPYDELRPKKGISYSRPQIWRKVKDGSFPRPIKVGAGRSAWVDSEIDAWIEQRMAARDHQDAT
ncbi:helix-turn-helix transcriptional regulator [Rhizobium ruizarguesonis]|uniref:helix-turn-helix transcriptional regulator n=1 Tax=Rhizobium ruizarguesonis TaxID=2081791 RepID=UPI0010304597|nr:AlpA family phage regulatory protein [Rhizobium ruizarguesonis]TBB88094.1 AlpA family phage regulatory protein [Rhizobium ruizarguesonis]TBC45055.1 AlpA family phage regulatory protein [Rhizobium ruizarguesonis]